MNILFFVDEIVFHRKRGLPRWERIGHPVDTFLTGIAHGYLVLNPLHAGGSVLTFGMLAIVSSIAISKDEWVHKAECTAEEMWFHSLLFILHPVTLICSAWLSSQNLYLEIIRGQVFLIAAVLVYQIVYWNFLWKPNLASTTPSTTS